MSKYDVFIDTNDTASGSVIQLPQHHTSLLILLGTGKVIESDLDEQ
ncbi:MAG: hypothetical protein WEA36_06005 [Balneolaceae bacterium]